MNDVGPVILVLLVLVAGVAGAVWHFGRSRDLLERLAARNRYRILTRERRTLRTGPYFFRHDDGQDVYRVTIRDANGQERSGYVRVGGWWFGMLSEAVDVTWDN